MDIVLIHPPVSRPCEPPPGLCLLAGALKAHNKECLVIDANMEGLMSLLSGPPPAGDTWTRRASHHLQENLASFGNGKAFRNMGSYTKAVTEISRVLEVKAQGYSTLVTLNNFQHETLSALRSADLLTSAEHPEANVFFPYFEKRLALMLKEHTPRIVGFSLNFLSQAIPTFAMIGHLRRLCSEVKIVLGGGLVTSWMRRSAWTDLFSGLVDKMVAGPGEQRILELTGLKQCCRNSLPDYSAFRHYNYLSPCKVIPYSTSMGCYWSSCSFCPEKAEGTRYACIPAKQVPDALDSLADSESPGLVHLTDNALSPALLNAMAEKGVHVPWYGFARFTPHLADKDFCAALKKSGCVMLQLGLESGDQDVLDELGKGISLEHASLALKALHDSGIGTYVYLLFGTPSEDKPKASKTLQYVTEHEKFIDFLNISIFNLPKGSKEALSLDTYDFSDGDLSLYEGFIHPKGWDRNVVRQFLDKEFKRHPAIARIIRNDPPYFTSNHAPFFIKNICLHSLSNGL